MSLFAYTSRAHEAKLPLGDFVHVRAWIERVEAQPGFLAAMYPYSIDLYSSGDLP
jgi:glutathione S-transferase